MQLRIRPADYEITYRVIPIPEDNYLKNDRAFVPCFFVFTPKHIHGREEKSYELKKKTSGNKIA